MLRHFRFHQKSLAAFTFISFFLSSGGDLPSGKSKTEAARKWRKSGDEEDSWADVRLLFYAMRFPCRGANCVARKINVFRINVSSSHTVHGPTTRATNTLAASHIRRLYIESHRRINEQERIALWWGWKNKSIAGTCAASVYERTSTTPEWLFHSSRKRQKGWKYHVRALVPFFLQSADK